MNAWTDYVVRAYFEIAPADFEFLLTRRPYEKLVVPEVLNMKVSEFRPCHLNRIFPEIEEFEVSDVYSWQETETMTSITIWTNKNRDRVFLMYGTD